jgi:site-specific recombinase XerD
MGLPTGDGVLDYRDRAILKTYLYTGVRLATACRLRVRDFHQDGDEATLTINEQGNRHRTIGIHFAATDAIAEYLAKAGLESGPRFRAWRAAHGRARRAAHERGQHVSRSRRIPGQAARRGPGWRAQLQHSFVAHHHCDVLLDAGVDIRKVQELLGHRHVATTPIHDQRRRTTKESVSYDVPI